MTNKRSSVLMSMAYVFMLIAGSVQAQPAQDVLQILPDLKSDDWTKRSVATGKVLALPVATQKSAEIVAALTDLLARENRVIYESYKRGVGVSSEYGEGYGDYYGRLLSTVLQIGNLNDSRTVKAIAEGSYNPDSALAGKLVDSARTALVPIALELVASDIGPQRWNGLGLLGLLYAKRQTYVLSQAAAENIKRTIVDAVRHRDASTRMEAITTLGQIGTSQDIPILQEIAKSDPVSRQHDIRGQIYPIRELATESISKIRKRNPGRSPE